jgi:hypothetical protein
MARRKVARQKTRKQSIKNPQKVVRKKVSENIPKNNNQTTGLIR